MQLTGAQIVIQQLLTHGVKTVFGYPGGAILPLYDELYKNTNKIHHILTAHEQGAAFAADGYARASGKTGVVIATSGPGATNLVTGIANAHLDSVPLVAITGNVSTPLLGRDSFQEVDIAGITQPIVKHSFVVRDIALLEDILCDAFYLANNGRPGAILVDIPKNVQEEMYDFQDKKPVTVERKKCSADTLNKVVEIIKECKRPFIYAGGGVISAGAEPELRLLSEKLSAPVGFSMRGLTALPDDYELNLGMSGMHGKLVSTYVKSECDVIIALGVRFSDRATGAIDAYKDGKIIIHVDIDLAEINKNIATHLEVNGDIKDVLTELLPLLPQMKHKEWLTRIRELKRTGKLAYAGIGFNPAGIIETTQFYCGDDVLIATDVGQHQMWVTQHYRFVHPRSFLSSGGLGAMGYGLGAAIGGSVSQNKKRTILFTGDGSFGMNLNELATAVFLELPIIVVILNNGALGLLRQLQGMYYDKRYSQSTLHRKTDFVAVAKAFGAEGYKAGSLKELEDALSRTPTNKPIVIDCHINIDEKVLPMIPAGGSVLDIIT